MKIGEESLALGFAIVLNFGRKDVLKNKVLDRDKGDRPVLEKQGNSRSISTPGKVLQQSAPPHRLLAHLGSNYDI